MQTREYWPRWADTLQRYKLNALAASFLEAGGPLHLLGAQALYIVRPFFGEDADALAHTLETTEEARAFASYLDQGADS